MYCDYDALKDYADVLNRNFNTIIKAIDNFEYAMNTVMMGSTIWDAPTRDYVFELYNKLKDNFDVISNKFNNANQCLDTVISNYKFAEQQMSNIF